jgi:hypothetical protein
VFDRFPDEPAYAQASSLSFTESSWAYNEILAGNCVEAAAHLVRARDLARTLTTSPWVEQNETFYQDHCGPEAN